MTTYPSLYKPDDAFADPYQARTAAFADEGLTAGLRPSVKDPRRVALVIVDMQHDFVHPTGNLSVPGAQDDVARLADWLYRNIEDVTSIYVSYDTHNLYHVFFPSWWAYEDGSHPDPFTPITLNPMGEAVNLVDGRRVRPLWDPGWTLSKYLPQLKANAQLDLMIWPYHTIEGSVGHTLMPVLSEAITFHSQARLSEVTNLVKGRCPQTEHFGIFSAEVPYPKDPSTGMNTSILDAIAQHDLIYVAGEAKSHCVLSTEKQLVGYFASQSDVVRKMRFLIDCTSSVAHPDIDFDGMANAELATMANQGVELVKSTDPIS